MISPAWTAPEAQNAPAPQAAPAAQTTPAKPAALPPAPQPPAGWLAAALLLDDAARLALVEIAEAVPPLAFDPSQGVPRTPFGKLIYKTALRFALNPQLVAALIRVESDFNPRAVSRKRACGLMQVLPATARRFGMRRRDLFNPSKNLIAGCRYLRWLVGRFGEDPLRVLAAYNAGEGNVERFGGLPPFPETRDYVQRIFARLGFALAYSPPASRVPIGTR
jgi:soluble lytic murein transglycosylase-like protein